MVWAFRKFCSNIWSQNISSQIHNFNCFIVCVISWEGRFVLKGKKSNIRWTTQTLDVFSADILGHGQSSLGKYLLFSAPAHDAFRGNLTNFACFQTYLILKPGANLQTASWLFHSLIHPLGKISLWHRNAQTVKIGTS